MRSPSSCSFSNMRFMTLNESSMVETPSQLLQTIACGSCWRPHSFKGWVMMSSPSCAGPSSRASRKGCKDHIAGLSAAAFRGGSSLCSACRVRLEPVHCGCRALLRGHCGVPSPCSAHPCCGISDVASIQGPEPLRQVRSNSISHLQPPHTFSTQPNHAFGAP
jgi:hypothetical protein